MADYPYPDPVVQVTDAQELARDLVVIPNRRVQLVPNIGIIGGTHSVLVIETGIGPRNAERVLEFAADYAKGLGDERGHDRRGGHGPDDQAAPRLGGTGVDPAGCRLPVRGAP
jgi:hypothetical protein